MHGAHSHEGVQGGEHWLRQRPWRQVSRSWCAARVKDDSRLSWRRASQHESALPLWIGACLSYSSAHQAQGCCHQCGGMIGSDDERILRDGFAHWLRLTAACQPQSKLRTVSAVHYQHQCTEAVAPNSTTKCWCCCVSEQTASATLFATAASAEASQPLGWMARG